MRRYGVIACEMAGRDAMRNWSTRTQEGGCGKRRNDALKVIMADRFWQTRKAPSLH